jgi:alkanesulfonate monooxygenase SsuD/methylene tetrahydromethanopterin reductase-like flavin-dependent oxidoreductase (luciferase family)
VDVGLFFTFRNPEPWRRDQARLYADCLEEIRVAEEVGFDSVWLGEHHFTDDGFVAAPLTVAAAIATVTSRIQIGTYCLLLPQHHPVRLAEAAAAVDILSGGRLILGLGLGYRPTESAALDLDFHRRGEVMDEALEVLVRCFTEESFSFQGRHFNFPEVAMTPKPVQSPMPRIVLGGAGERMLQRSARFGCTGLAIAPSPALLDRHTQLIVEHGGDPVAQRYYGMALGFVAETEQKAWEVAEPHATWELEHYNKWFTEAGLPPQFPGGVAGNFILGDSAQWVAAVERMLSSPEPLRCDHLVVELTTSGMPHTDVLRGIERFATDVLPALRVM